MVGPGGIAAAARALATIVAASAAILAESITAKHGIVGATFQTSASAATGIKINVIANTIVGYSGGSAIFTLGPSGLTLTGAIESGSTITGTTITGSSLATTGDGIVIEGDVIDFDSWPSSTTRPAR